MARRQRCASPEAAAPPLKHAGLAASMALLGPARSTTAPRPLLYEAGVSTMAVAERNCARRKAAPPVLLPGVSAPRMVPMVRASLKDAPPTLPQDPIAANTAVEKREACSVGGCPDNVFARGLCGKHGGKKPCLSKVAPPRRLREACAENTAEQKAVPAPPRGGLHHHLSAQESLHNTRRRQRGMCLRRLLQPTDGEYAAQRRRRVKWSARGRLP